MCRAACACDDGAQAALACRFGILEESVRSAMRAHDARFMRNPERAQHLHGSTQNFVVALAAHHHANQRLLSHAVIIGDAPSAPKDDATNRFAQSHALLGSQKAIDSRVVHRRSHASKATSMIANSTLKAARNPLARCQFCSCRSMRHSRSAMRPPLPSPIRPFICVFSTLKSLNTRASNSFIMRIRPAPSTLHSADTARYPAVG